MCIIHLSTIFTLITLAMNFSYLKPGICLKTVFQSFLGKFLHRIPKRSFPPSHVYVIKLKKIDYYFISNATENERGKPKSFLGPAAEIIKIYPLEYRSFSPSPLNFSKTYLVLLANAKKQMPQPKVSNPNFKLISSTI